LLECIAAGLNQLVIIGAGFDTRAYRFEEVKENLKVFEVDHPVTQQVKVEKIKEIFGELPDHVIYVPVVFGADRLDRKLLENGYEPKLKTLFIVEGLLMYVPPPAVDGLLSLIVNASGPGSSFVADYFSAAVIEGIVAQLFFLILLKPATCRHRCWRHPPGLVHTHRNGRGRGRRGRRCLSDGGFSRHVAFHAADVGRPGPGYSFPPAFALASFYGAVTHLKRLE
jgi:hypothetical protein